MDLNVRYHQISGRPCRQRDTPNKHNTIKKTIKLKIYNDEIVSIPDLARTEPQFFLHAAVGTTWYIRGRYCGRRQNKE